MTNDAIRRHCLSLPQTTEVVQWQDHLLFKVAGKMFAIIELDGHRCSLRCAPERYAELVELADIGPSGHNMWKYHWVTFETLSAVPDDEFRELLSGSYEIVRDRLPKTVKTELDAARAATARRAGPTSRTTRRASPARRITHREGPSGSKRRGR